ncbi:MAG: serpin family protein, partial [Nocardioidaceae bacterium]
TYCSTSEWTAVRLDYAGRQTAMAVVVPNAGVSLATVEAGLCTSGLAGLLTRFRPAGTVHVELPRWRFRVQALLNESLSTLGMPTAFDLMRADLSAMTTQERLYISHVLHEAFIAVDEVGTEAAAATGVVARAMSLAPPPALSVVADRPFMFVLFDVETTTPLFVGRVSDPTR